MKKVLLATTAMALSAGVAYAEVTISGAARMGLQYNNGKADLNLDGDFLDAGENVGSSTRIEKRMTVDINASTESSSGITFGAKMRLRSNEAGATIATGARVYLQTSGFELAMGNIDGAIESMPNVYSPSVGLTGLGWGGLVTNTAGNGYWQWDAYSSSGNGAEGVEMIYTAGAFTGHISYSDNTLSSGATVGKHAAAYGAYTMNDWTVALGVARGSFDMNGNGLIDAAELDNGDKVVLTVGGNIGDYGVGFGIADNDGTTKIALNGSATFGATTVSAYVADEDTAGADTSYGLGMSYDLGGAAVVGGLTHDAFGTNRADLGVSFSF